MSAMSGGRSAGRGRSQKKGRTVRVQRNGKNKQRKFIGPVSAKQQQNINNDKLKQLSIKEQKQKQKRKRGKEILQEGNIKIDSRDVRLQGSNRNASTSNYLANAENSLAFDVAANPQVFQGFPMGLISYCVARGFAAAADTPSIPYLAFCYLVNLMQSYALNNVPQGILVPRCVQIVGQSLMQKTVRAQGGSVTYKFAFETSSAPNANTNIGPLTTNSWNLFVPTDVQVNNTFFVGGEPTVYSPAAGQSAWTALLQFLTQTNTQQNQMLKLVSPSEQTKYAKSVSAFAVVLADPGGGFANVGGLGCQKSLEVPIYEPLLAVNYANPNNLPDPNRYSEFTLASAGDGLLLGAMADWLPEKFLGMKKPVTYKPYDCLEYIDVYALVLTKAFSALFADSQFQTQINSFDSDLSLQNYINTMQCPLTLQEFVLCMRAQIMNVVKDTQPFVQTVYPRTEASSGENLFAAWVASITQCATPGQTQMLIPTILIENIKAMTYLISDRANKRDPIIILPVAGSYLQDLLLTSDYSVTVQNSQGYSAVFDVFVTNPSEVSISVIDGLTPTAQALFINDPSELQILITEFNNWLQVTTQLTSFTSTMSTITTDAGATILTNNNMSTYWLAVQENEVQRVGVVGSSSTEKSKTSISMAERRVYWEEYKRYLQLKNSKKPIAEPKVTWASSGREKRFGCKRYGQHHLDTSVYSQKQIIDYTARFAPLAATWENIQGIWIKPVFNAVNEGSPNSSDQVLRIAAQQREFIQVVPSVATNGVLTLAQQHDQFASIMVGARNSVKGQAFQRMFDDLSRQGLGSIFSDLASAFGTAVSVGAPLIGQLVKASSSIMPMLPIM
jgi:hypothetical protein